MAEPDVIMLRIAEGIELGQRGDRAVAREQLARGRVAADALGDDGYGRMIRAGLDRLADRLGPWGPD